MAWDPISAGLEFAGKVVDRIWPDATEAQKAQASQIIAEMAHRENLFKAEVEDRASARDRESAIATSEAAPLLNKVVTPALAIGVVGLTFLLFAVVLIDSSVIDTARKDLAVYILGALTSICGMVISYYFGSSSGSSQKTGYLENLLKK